MHVGSQTDCDLLCLGDSFALWHETRPNLFGQQLHSKKAIFFLWLLCLRVGRGQKKATMMNEPEEEGEDKKALVQFSEFQEDIQSEDSTHRRRKIDYDDEVRTGQPPSGIWFWTFLSGSKVLANFLGCLGCTLYSSSTNCSLRGSFRLHCSSDYYGNCHLHRAKRNAVV